MFYDVLERKNKNASLGHKNKKLTNLKNCDFSKGVSPGFAPKYALLLYVVILAYIGQENVFYDVLERKNAF